jgi:predicted transcriptional regulator
MAKKSGEPRPSDAEMEVLKALWAHGDASAREVHERLPEELGWAYSTTRTVLERMRAKGLVTRRSVHGLAVFAPADEKVGLLARMIRDFSRRVLGVDGPLPVSAFTGSSLLTDAEIAELEARLQEDEENGR